jgi:hypothetical protein
LTSLADERWLLVISAGGSRHLDAYHYICSQMSMAAAYQKVLAVLDDTEVEVLTG